MKKIAKGVTLLLTTLFLLMTMPIICSAEEVESMEAENQTSQANFTIKNSLERDFVKVYVEDNVLYIENQSSEELGEVCILITINDKSTRIESEPISGFGSYSLKLTDYFSQETINENDLKIELINANEVVFSIFMFVHAFFTFGALIIVVVYVFTHGRIGY